MKKLCILIIDDNPDDRKLTIRELNKEFKITAIEIKNAVKYLTTPLNIWRICNQDTIQG